MLFILKHLVLSRTQTYPVYHHSGGTTRTYSLSPSWIRGDGTFCLWFNEFKCRQSLQIDAPSTGVWYRLSIDQQTVELMKQKCAACFSVKQVQCVCLTGSDTTSDLCWVCSALCDGLSAEIRRLCWVLQTSLSFLILLLLLLLLLLSAAGRSSR